MPFGSPEAFDPQAWRSKHSLSFDGSNEYLEKSSGFVLPSTFTVLLRYKATAGHGTCYLLDFYGGPAYNRNRLRCYLTAANLIGTLYDDDTTYLGVSASSSDGAWHCAAFRYDGSTFALFLDSATVADSASGSKSFATTEFHVGQAYFDASRYTGLISQVVIFTGAIDVAPFVCCPTRSPLDHPALFAAYNPSHIQDSAASGGTINDWSPSGLDLTPYNMEAADITSAAP